MNKKKWGLCMRLLQGVSVGGECTPPMRSAEALANLYLKSVKNGFSTAYLLITPAVLHAQVLEFIYQNIGGLHAIIDKRGGKRDRKQHL